MPRGRRSGGRSRRHGRGISHGRAVFDPEGARRKRAFRSVKRGSSSHHRGLKPPADSRYAKIMHVMQMAEANRPQMRRIADRLGSWYTLVALVVAAVGWILG